MKRLKKVSGRYLALSDYEIQETFDIYELGSYNFDENIDFGDSAGVYIFTKRDMSAELNSSYQRHMFSHTLIYCGMTKELDSRFYSHFRKEEIMEHKADRICIHKCKNSEDAEALEKILLATFNFPVNEKDNSNPKYPDVKKVLEAF